MSKLPWKPWHQVVKLRPDLLTGELSMTQFAADLYEVVMDRGSSVYRTPYEFFSLTYPTYNLRELAKDVVHRLAGKSEKAVRQLTKYQGKLFTFLKYDGIPWNNNNAEHAIKQFVYYRERTDGIIRETGLEDYLVLLSVCQTCKYRGISFLKFLLSRERDIDAFSDGRRARQLPAFEVYPKGFTPFKFADRKASKQRR